MVYLNDRNLKKTTHNFCDHLSMSVFHLIFHKFSFMAKMKVNIKALSNRRLQYANSQGETKCFVSKHISAYG